jgi:tetratricopeptide (TPR) repeat protein
MTNKSSMRLSGQQAKQLERALMSAFPSIDDLARVVRFGLDKNLSEISESGSLKDTVFQLIQWAEAQGRVKDLIEAAYAENPGNPELQLVKNDPHYAKLQQTAQSYQASSQQSGEMSGIPPSGKSPTRKPDARQLPIWQWVTIIMTVAVVGLLIALTPFLQQYLQRLTRTPTADCNLTPNQVDTSYNRGLAYNAQQEWDKAIEEFNKVLLCKDKNDGEKNAGAYENRGIAYLRKREWESAIQDNKAAIQYDNQDPRTHYRLCWVYALRSDPLTALDYCNAAIELEPEPRFFGARGLANALLSNREAAIEDIQLYIDALEAVPDPQRSREYKGWLAALEAGDNPFMPEVRAELLQNHPLGY